MKARISSVASTKSARLAPANSLVRARRSTSPTNAAVSLVMRATSLLGSRPNSW